VKFTVTQLSPSCRRVGSFRVAGRPGRNTVAFTGRVNGRTLAPGTYRIEARAAGNRRVLRMVVVITQARPSRADLAAALSANVCGALLSTIFGAVFRPAIGSFGSSTAVPGSAHRQGRGGVLAERRSEAEPSRSGLPAGLPAREAIPLLVLTVIALSILLLGVGVLPATAIPHPRAAQFVAEYRPLIATGGAAALIGVAIAYLVH
jgi:hypothetical protein